MISFHYMVAVLLFSVGVYCLLVKRNLIKMIIGLQIMTNGIHLFLVSLGYRAGGEPSILSGDLLSRMDISEYAASAVDPLPQALVLTSIVINLAIMALGLSLIICVYRRWKTLDVNEIRGMHG